MFVSVPKIMHVVVWSGNAGVSCTVWQQKREVIKVRGLSRASVIVQQSTTDFKESG